MKNKFLQITAIALFAFPYNSFCQTNEAPVNPQNKVAITTVLETDHCFANGECFSALIDNTKLQLKGFRPITATLVESPAQDMGARTIVSIAIGGNSGAASDSMLNETIQMQLVLNEPISPGDAICKVTMNHQSVAYAMVKGDASNVEVTDFIWSMDRKSFMLSLKFNCTMRSLGFPADGKKDVNLKGQIVRVQVTSTNAIAASN